MVLGIGTDILNIHNIEKSVSSYDDPFVKLTYTERELLLIKNRPVPLYSFATRFSGKEAVFKALSAYGNEIRLNEIEILEDPNGSPCVILHGNAKKKALHSGITRILISLSYDTDYAIAYATAVK